VTGFDFRAPGGTLIGVDPADPTVEGLVVFRRQADGTLAAALGVKSYATTSRDELLDVLEDLADTLSRHAPTPKGLTP